MNRVDHGRLLGTVYQLQGEADQAARCMAAALWQALQWRTVGDLCMARLSERTALQFASDARDLRATARDLLAGAR